MHINERKNIFTATTTMPTYLRRRTSELIATHVPSNDICSDQDEDYGKISPHIDHFYTTKRKLRKGISHSTMSTTSDHSNPVDDMVDNNHMLSENDDDGLVLDDNSNITLSSKRNGLHVETWAPQEPLLSNSLISSARRFTEEDECHQLHYSRRSYATYISIASSYGSQKHSNHSSVSQVSDDDTAEERTEYNSDGNKVYDDWRSDESRKNRSMSLKRIKNMTSSSTFVNVVWISHFVLALIVIGCGRAKNSNPQRYDMAWHWSRELMSTFSFFNQSNENRLAKLQILIDSAL
jgi:hypothetical protein